MTWRELLLIFTIGLSAVSGWNVVLNPSEERLQNKRSGDNFLVVCKVKEFDGAASDVKIEWYRNGNLIPRFGSIMTIERTYSNQLMINRPKISDGGKYTCKAEIQGEEQEAIAEISFVDPPQFVNVESNQHPEEGTRAEIHCEVTGTDNLEVFWQFNGATLDETSQRGYEFSENNQILYIPHFNAKSDDGIYNCNAAQYSSFETLSINVTGYARPTITVFDVPSENRGIEGHTIELKCGAVGKPKPSYKWFFENSEVPIARSDKHNVDEGLLIIESLNSEDAGNYKCVANNTVGSSERQFDLSVFLKPTVDLKHEHVAKEGENLEVVCGYHGDGDVSAKFVFGSEEFSVKNQHQRESEEKEEDAATASVEETTESSNGDASSSADSKEIELSSEHSELAEHEETVNEENEEKRKKRSVDSAKISIHDENNKLILKIENVTLENAGEYKCVVSNDAGITTKTTKLGIIHPPTLRHYTGPYIRSFNGNKISIYCDVSAVPSPKWKWMKNGEEVEANGVSIQIDTQDTSTKLTLENYEGSDNFGKYTCHADNGVGQLEKEIEVIQVVKPETPVGLECKKIIYPNFGKCTFNTEIYSNESSKPEKIEFLIGRLEDSSSDFNWDNARSINVEYDEELTIPDLATNTQYTMKARAVNDAGSSEYSEEFSLETTDPWAPQAPPSVKIECADYCTVTWGEPNDNGSPLEKYRIIVQELRHQSEEPDEEKEEETIEEETTTESEQELFQETAVETESNEHGEEIQVEDNEDTNSEIPIENDSAEILPTDPPTSAENDGEIVPHGSPVVIETDATETQLQLITIKPHSLYKISISAVNAIGQGEESEIELQTDDSPTKYSESIDNMYIVIGVASVALFLFFVVDLGCFITNRCGLISCICLNVCGRNSGAKSRDLESGRNGPESNRLLESTGAR